LNHKRPAANRDSDFQTFQVFLLLAVKCLATNRKTKLMNMHMPEKASGRAHIKFGVRSAPEMGVPARLANAMMV